MNAPHDLLTAEGRATMERAFRYHSQGDDPATCALAYGVLRKVVTDDFTEFDLCSVLIAMTFGLRPPGFPPARSEVLSSTSADPVQVERAEHLAGLITSVMNRDMDGARLLWEGTSEEWRSATCHRLFHVALAAVALRRMGGVADERVAA